MKTQTHHKSTILLGALALSTACFQARAVDFHVSTAQELQSALFAAANNGANNNVYLTNGNYEGNFSYNSSGSNNLTVLAEPGLTNTQIIIDAGGVGGSGLTIQSSAIGNTITVQGISFAANGGNAAGALGGYPSALCQSALGVSRQLL